MPLRLIVTGDDLGYSVGRNDGIVRAFKEGVVRRSSLMVNAVQCKDAVRRAKEFEIPLGLHFNMSEGLPVSQPESVQSLLAPEGFFLTKEEHVKARGIIQSDQVELELEAQLNRFEELVGSPPLYVDGHQHLHIDPSVVETFARVLCKHGVKETRLPREQDIHTHTWLTAWFRTFNTRTVELSQQAATVFDKYGILYSDYYLGLSTMGADMTEERLATGLQTIRETARAGDTDSITCELMCHPGIPTKLDEHSLPNKAQIAGCGQGPDDFDQSPGRQHEIDVLTGHKMASLLEGFEVTLTHTCQL